MIRFYQGDILNCSADTITITVNCKGVMGKGLALQAKKQHPTLFNLYKRLCDEGEMKPGEPRLAECDGKKFILFPTKDDWRNPSQMEWIDSGLAIIAKNIDKLGSLALPPLGCGNGGLNFYGVLNLMLKHLEGIDADIRIYPKGQ